MKPYGASNKLILFCIYAMINLNKYKLSLQVIEPASSLAAPFHSRLQRGFQAMVIPKGRT